MLYRCKCDEYLTNILKSEGRDKYTTPQIQNEIISSCGNLILQSIVKKINNSQCFTVLEDKTTDISVTEQLTLCVRFIDEQNNVNECFLKFMEINGLTGKKLG